MVDESGPNRMEEKRKGKRLEMKRMRKKRKKKREGT